MLILKPLGGSHPGDNTFRELIDIWSELGLVDVAPSPDDYCWAVGHGGVLLYDYPRLDDRHVPQFRYGLFGNTVPDHERCGAWTFWARHPRALEAIRGEGLASYPDRSLESVFLGRIENGVQQAHRRGQDWSTAGIELFGCPIETRPGSYLFTQEDYLRQLGQSRFGLALAGYGPKCNREIELLGMGTVPLLAPQVDTTYAEPLIDGVHFLRVNGPADVHRTIASVSEDHWQTMQDAGQQWYARNAAPRGAFMLTMRLIRQALATSASAHT